MLDDPVNLYITMVSMVRYGTQWPGTKATFKPPHSNATSVSDRPRPMILVDIRL